MTFLIVTFTCASPLYVTSTSITISEALFSLFPLPYDFIFPMKGGFCPNSILSKERVFNAEGRFFCISGSIRSLIISFVISSMEGHSFLINSFSHVALSVSER